MVIMIELIFLNVIFFFFFSTFNISLALAWESKQKKMDTEQRWI